MLLRVLEREMNWDDAGPNDDNPLGVRLRFVKIDEQVTPLGLVATRYRVFAEGAPENLVYGLRTWLIGEDSIPDLHDLYVNAQGLLMLHKPKPSQEASFKAQGDEFDIISITGSAEPMRYLFFSMDGRFQIFGTLVPHPLVSENRGCTLELRIAQPDATAVMVVANLFPPEARVPIVLESGGKTASEVLTTDTNGHAVMAAFPYVTGQTRGVLKASGEGADCLPSVVLRWGTAGPAAPETRGAPETSQR
jgi:hypothetical protein